MGGRGAGGSGEGGHCGGVVALLPTKDLADRAHAVFEIGPRGESMLVPAGPVRGEPGGRGARAIPYAAPRLYPRSQMTSRGVAFDSSFDELHERQKSLEGATGVSAPQEHMTMGAQALRARIEAGSKVINRNRKAFATASVGQLARGYYMRGMIAREEYVRMAGGG